MNLTRAEEPSFCYSYHPQPTLVCWCVFSKFWPTLRSQINFHALVARGVLCLKLSQKPKRWLMSLENQFFLRRQDKWPKQYETRAGLIKRSESLIVFFTTLFTDMFIEAACLVCIVVIYANKKISGEFECATTSVARADHDVRIH